MLATFSDSGWVDDPSELLGRIFSYFLVAEKSQSNHFSISSLPHILQEYAGDLQGAVGKIQRELQTLYGNYTTPQSVGSMFDTVNIEVLNETENNSALAIFSVFIEASKNSKVYNLSKVVTTDRSGVKTVIDRING